jgi:DNA-binding response OmpR family regulator
MTIAMPVLDGRTAMRLLASDPATAHVPMLGLSAQISLHDEPALDAFRVKPVEPDQLLALIRTALRPQSGGTAGKEMTVMTITVWRTRTSPPMERFHHADELARSGGALAQVAQGCR